MDPAKHVSKNKETGMYCVYDNKGKKVKEFEDKKDAVAWATKNHDDLMKEMVDPMDLRGRPKKKDPHPNSPYGLKHPLHPSNIAKRKERQKKAATIKQSESVEEAKVHSKPAKLPRAVAMNSKVRAAQKAHAKGDWDGNVDKEGNAIVHINSKPYTVTKQESVNTADRKPETYRKSDGKMGTRMVPTHKDVVKEGTEVGETKWAAVNMFAGGDKFGGRGVQITGLNGQGKANMELIRQKGAYMQMPAKELPKLIKLLQQAMKMTRDTKNEELDEGMTPAQKAAHAKAIAAFKARGGKVTKLPPGKAAGYHGKDDPGSGVHGMLSKPDSKKFNTKKKVRSMTADTQKESVDMKSFFDVRKAATLDVNQLDEYMGGGGMSGFQGQANRNKYGEHGANPHHHMDHAKAAFKAGMKSKSAIIKHVQNKTGQKIHPDVHKAIHNTSGLKD